MTEAFINCNIWEVDSNSRQGIKWNYYPLINIFFYNSLEDKTFDKSLSNITKEPYIHLVKFQIPENIIKELDVIWNINEKDHIMYGYKTIKEFIFVNKDIIIKNRYPIIKREYDRLDEKENWSVDLNMIFYDKNKDWKNES
jgi:hypothetical protein